MAVLVLAPFPHGKVHLIKPRRHSATIMCSHLAQWSRGVFPRNPRELRRACCLMTRQAISAPKHLATHLCSTTSLRQSLP